MLSRVEEETLKAKMAEEEKEQIRTEASKLLDKSTNELKEDLERQHRKQSKTLEDRAESLQKQLLSAKIEAGVKRKGLEEKIEKMEEERRSWEEEKKEMEEEKKEM